MRTWVQTAGLLGLPGLLGLLGLLGCDVPVRDLDTGGISVGGAGGSTPGAAGASVACHRGFAVASSDYQSSNVSLIGVDGDVLSASFISSASSAAGLSAALSGDVVFPSGSATGDHLVLIDRYPAAVLTWVELGSSRVTAQLSVATGFAANPHDYVAISPTKAYVPRFGANLAPGREPFDAGSDLLVVDPSRPAIVGRIDLSVALTGESAQFSPRPERALRLADRVVVVLGGYRSDFTTTAASRLVVIDAATDRLVQVLVLDGFHACSTLARSPTGDELAVACSGEWGGDNRPELASSGVVRISVGEELSVTERYFAAQLGEGPVATGLAYASSRHLLVTTFGQFAGAGAPAADDALLELDLETGATWAVLRSAGEPFTLGAVSCDPACGVCYLTDAQRERGVVHRYEVGPDGLRAPAAIRPERSIGLPPRALGRF